MDPREPLLRDTLNILTTGDLGLVPESLHAEAEASIAKHESWMSAPNVVGFGIGERTTAGYSVPEVCLKVYVRRKRALSALGNHERIPGQVLIPGIEHAGIDPTVSTDIEEIEDLMEEGFKTRARPVTPGCSVGHVTKGTGSLGCIVREVGSQTLLGLSNCHVLADYGRASVGDAILQPGPDDGGTPGDKIGELVRFNSFLFTDGYDNVCDAAVFKFDSTIQTTKAIPQLGIPSGLRTDIARGLQIQKTGRTTEHTIGVIRDVDFRFRLPQGYPSAAHNGARIPLGFRDQVLCTRYTGGGDSGAIVCDMLGRVVGLHFVGGPSASVFTPIRVVLNELKIELVDHA